MNTNVQKQIPREWAISNFSGAELTHIKRVDRAVTIAEAMAMNPGASLPQMFANRYDLKAAYKFFRHPETTPDNLQYAHREQSFMEIEKPGQYLLIEDTTEIFCSEGEEIEGLGPIGSSKERKIGFHLHSTLAVGWPVENNRKTPSRPNVEIIGLVDQQYHVRRPRIDKPVSSLRRVKPAQELESVLWEQASQRLGPSPATQDIKWIKVSDRASDIYDHLQECRKQGHSYVIRANIDRPVIDAEGNRIGTLFEIVRQSSSQGELNLKLRARPAVAARTAKLRTRPAMAARTAKLQISITRVILRSPQTKGHGPGAKEPIHCTAVRVWEPLPPDGVDALEWILITDLPVENVEQACEIAQIYSTRWLIEEFHKALKTGMGAERLQLTTAKAWFSAVAMMSVTALRLIGLRETVRQKPDAPAEDFILSSLELEVLRARISKPLLTVSDVALAIGRLGGHLNRKGDGMPGWITLWRGWRELQILVEGVLLARKLIQSG